MYSADVVLADQKFTVEANDLLELWQNVAHIHQMSYRIRSVPGYVKVENPRWVHREAKGNDFYEVGAKVNDVYAKMRVSAAKDTKKNPLGLYIAGNSRWERFDKESNRTLIFEQGDWVPATYEGTEGWRLL